MSILSMDHPDMSRPAAACSISDAQKLEERLCRSEHPGIADLKMMLFTWSRSNGIYFS